MACCVGMLLRSTHRNHMYGQGALLYLNKMAWITFNTHGLNSGIMVCLILGWSESAHPDGPWNSQKLQDFFFSGNEGGIWVQSEPGPFPLKKKSWSVDAPIQ